MAGKFFTCMKCDKMFRLPGDPGSASSSQLQNGLTERRPDSQAPHLGKSPPAQPIPGWAWIFVAACGIIPIPAAIGAGGAGGCISVARNPSIPVGGRFAGCLGITVACWVAVFLLVAAVIAAGPRR
jgi:hypothetical protein